MKKLITCRTTSFILLGLLVPLFGFSQLKSGFTASVKSGCTPLVVNFTDTSSGAPSNWNWDLGNGATSTEQNPGVIYINPGTYNIKLVVSTAALKDSVVKSQYITVYALPAVEFSATPTTGCEPLKVTFSNGSKPGSGTISSTVWDFGDGAIAKEAAPVHYFSGLDSFHITLSVINSYGCKQTMVKRSYITIPTHVNADFGYSYSNVCQVPAQVDFSDLSVSNSTLTYNWIFGDGTTSTEKNPSHSFTTSGDFSVKLISKTSTGCADTAIQKISIGSVLAAFKVSDSVCTAQNLFFQNTSNPVAETVTWDFGDGTTDNAYNATHFYNTPGTYTVNMYANFGNCSGVATKTILVSNKPKPSFLTPVNKATCLIPVSYSFTNSSTGATSYKWLFGDNTSATDVNATHAYNTSGSFNVQLVAYSASGCNDTANATNALLVGNPKITGFKNMTKSGCAPFTTDFEAIIVSAVPITSYKWTFSDGGSSTDKIPVHTFVNAGIYDVSLTITTAEGCTASYSYPQGVEVGNRPKADFVAAPLLSCASLPINFTDKSSADVTQWQWFFGDGGSSVSQNPSYLYKDTGYFDITLIATNKSCSDTLTIHHYVKIKPPIAKFNKQFACSSPYFYSFTDKSIGAETWSWSFGDGAVATTPNVAHTYTKTGTYAVVLKVTNGECDNWIMDSIRVIDGNPSLSYTQAKFVCRNDVITFKLNNFVPKDYKSVSWDYGNGTVDVKSSAVTSNQYKYTQTGTFLPKLVTTDANGCLDTLLQKVNIVVYGPKVGFTSPEGACINSIVAFKDTSASDGMHPITSWTWNYGDGVVETRQAPPFQHQYTVAKKYNVQLKVTDSYGCSDSLIRSAPLITKPLAAFSVTDSFTCMQTSIKFYNNSKYSPGTNTWYFGDGAKSADYSSVYNYKKEGIFSVKLVISDKYGCKDSLEKKDYITVSNPHAAFNLADTVGKCPPLFIEPQNTSSAYRKLTWQFGDGVNSTLTSPQHNYNVPGSYTLKLIAKGYGNCYDTVSKNILLKGPWGTLDYTTLKGCVPTNVKVSSVSKNTAQYVWDFDNGVIKTTTADNFTNLDYKAAGSYVPKLVLVDAAGCRVSVVNGTPIVISDVDAKFSDLSPGNSFCDSALKKFADQSVVKYDSIKSYSWNFGDGVASAGSSASHYYNNTGTYSVKLSLVTKNGCKDTAAVPFDVVVNKSPVFSAVVKDSVCERVLVKFNAATVGTETFTWSWSFGDNTTSTKSIVEHAYSGGGNYAARVEALAASGCKTSKSIPVFIYGAPTVDAGKDTIVCFGNSLMLAAKGAVKYSWTADASLSCLNCSQPIAKPAASSWYYTTGYNVAGCKGVDSVYIKVAQPLSMHTELKKAICAGQTTTLSVTGADKVQWQPAQYVEDPNAATTKFTGTDPREYKYVVLGKDNYNCFSDTAMVTVKVYPMPTIEIVNKTLNANVGMPVKLETKSSADVTKWQWSPAAGLNNPTLAEPTLVPKANATYTVTASNDGNCVRSEQLTVNVLCDGKNVFMPNTFSPNGDGMNERFYPHGKGIFNIKSLRVFNRWGQVVFEKLNFNADDPEQGWDGKYKGAAQSVDVYVYMMELVCDNGFINKINGNVTLLR